LGIIHVLNLPESLANGLSPGRAMSSDFGSPIRRGPVPQISETEKPLWAADVGGGKGGFETWTSEDRTFGYHIGRRGVVDLRRKIQLLPSCAAKKVWENSTMMWFEFKRHLGVDKVNYNLTRTPFSALAVPTDYLQQRRDDAFRLSITTICHYLRSLCIFYYALPSRLKTLVGTSLLV